MKRKRPTLAQLITAQRHLLKAQKGLIEEIGILRRYILEMRGYYPQGMRARAQYGSPTMGDVKINWHTGSYSPTDSIDSPQPRL